MVVRVSGRILRHLLLLRIPSGLYFGTLFAEKARDDCGVLFCHPKEAHASRAELRDDRPSALRCSRHDPAVAEASGGRRNVLRSLCRRRRGSLLPGGGRHAPPQAFARSTPPALLRFGNRGVCCFIAEISILLRCDRIEVRGVIAAKVVRSGGRGSSSDLCRKSAPVYQCDMCYAAYLLFVYWRPRQKMRRVLLVSVCVCVWCLKGSFLFLCSRFRVGDNLFISVNLANCSGLDAQFTLQLFAAVLAGLSPTVATSPL